MYHYWMRNWIALLIVLAVLLPTLALGATEDEEIQVNVTEGPLFPRLAMWHPSFDRNTLEECARYDVVVGNFHIDLYWNPARGTFAQALRVRNPNMKIMTYFTNSVLRHSSLWGGTEQFNPYMGDWPEKWFLTEAGTTLGTAIDRNQELIKVSNWKMTGPRKGNKPKEWDIFRIDEDVLCDGEIMTVIGLQPDTNEIIVKRGMNGTRKVEHAAGCRIAPILRFWAGSYILNLTDDCPTAQLHGATKPELFSEYSFRMSQKDKDDWFWYIGGDQDGFLFDLMADTITWSLWSNARSIDLNHDNVPDPFDELDAKWKAGIDHVTELFREKFPRKAIIRNNCRGRRWDLYEGENFESWPHFEWAEWDIGEVRGKTKYWHRFFFGHPDEERGGIIEFVNGSREPAYIIMSTCDFETDLDAVGHPELINPDKPDIYKPNYRKLRWGITSALLAGCYYCFVVHTDGHGQLGLLWFDEYDDSHKGNIKGRGYLGMPITGIQKLHTDPKHKEWGAWGREFDYGYVVCNPLDYDVTVELPPGKWQRIKGAQDKDVNTGAIEEGSVTVQSYDGLILKRWVEGDAGASMEDNDGDGRPDSNYETKLPF